MKYLSIVTDKLHKITYSKKEMSAIVTDIVDKWFVDAKDDEQFMIIFAKKDDNTNS